MGLAVIGVGSWCSRDDAVGLMLVDELSRNKPRSGLSFHSWDDADAFTIAHELITLTEPALIVDCADMNLRGGECRAFGTDEVRFRLKNDSVSTHGFGLAEAIEIARGLGWSHAVTIFGVQPFDCTPTSGLSAPMRDQFPELVRALRSSIDALMGDA